VKALANHAELRQISGEVLTARRKALLEKHYAKSGWAPDPDR